MDVDDKIKRTPKIAEQCVKSITKWFHFGQQKIFAFPVINTKLGIITSAVKVGIQA